LKQVCGETVDTTGDLEASPFYVPCEGKVAIKHGGRDKRSEKQEGIKVRVG
jgi:hypothetical protein